eukprot:952144-Pleurochrysis_carterae.AAC.1
MPSERPSLNDLSMVACIAAMRPLSYLAAISSSMASDATVRTAPSASAATPPALAYASPIFLVATRCACCERRGRREKDVGMDVGMGAARL